MESGKAPILAQPHRHCGATVLGAQRLLGLGFPALVGLRIEEARGERILSNTGQPVQLIRPLDFLAITEHAEMIGLATTMRQSDPRLLAPKLDAFPGAPPGRRSPRDSILLTSSPPPFTPFP